MTVDIKMILCQRPRGKFRRNYVYGSFNTMELIADSLLAAFI